MAKFAVLANSVFVLRHQHWEGTNLNGEMFAFEVLATYNYMHACLNILGERRILG